MKLEGCLPLESVMLALIFVRGKLENLGLETLTSWYLGFFGPESTLDKYLQPQPHLQFA